MKLSEGIIINDLALYLKNSNVLILADTHIGYEEALNKQGILIPRFQFKEIIQRLEKVISLLSRDKGAREWGTSSKDVRQRKSLFPLFDKIIINGDIKT